MRFPTIAIWSLLGLPLVAQAGQTNHIPSCYQANKMNTPDPIPKMELFIAIDKTTPLDRHLKQQVFDIANNQLKAGNAFSILSFSAYNQGQYLTLVSQGQIEQPIIGGIRDSISTKLLKQLDACLQGQQRYAKQLVFKQLEQTLTGASDTLSRSDVIYSIKEISHRVGQSTAKNKIVLIVSDMLENSSVTSFYSKKNLRKIVPKQEIAKLEQAQLLGQFKGASVYVLGAGLIPSTHDAVNKMDGYRDPLTMQLLQQFWKLYIEKSGGKLVEFGQPSLIGSIS